MSDAKDRAAMAAEIDAAPNLARALQEQAAELDRLRALMTTPTSAAMEDMEHLDIEEVRRYAMAGWGMLDHARDQRDAALSELDRLRATVARVERACDEAEAPLYGAPVVRCVRQADLRAALDGDAEAGDD